MAFIANLCTGARTALLASTEHLCKLVWQHRPSLAVAWHMLSPHMHKAHDNCTAMHPQMRVTKPGSLHGLQVLLPANLMHALMKQQPTVHSPARPASHPQPCQPCA